MGATKKMCTFEKKVKMVQKLIIILRSTQCRIGQIKSIGQIKKNTKKLGTRSIGIFHVQIGFFWNWINLNFLAKGIDLVFRWQSVVSYINESSVWNKGKLFSDLSKFKTSTELRFWPYCKFPIENTFLTFLVLSNFGGTPPRGWPHNCSIFIKRNLEGNH